MKRSVPIGDVFLSGRLGMFCREREIMEGVVAPLLKGLPCRWGQGRCHCRYELLNGGDTMPGEGVYGGEVVEGAQGAAAEKFLFVSLVGYLQTGKEQGCEGFAIHRAGNLSKWQCSYKGFL